MAPPIERADRADDEDFSDRPCSRVPTQRQRQDRAQHCECTQQVDGPEATAIAIAKPDRALIEPAMLHFDGRDHGLEALRGLGKAHRLQRLPMYPQEQQTLNDLVECHERLAYSHGLGAAFL